MGYQLPPLPTAIIGIAVIVIAVVTGKIVLAAIGAVLLAVAALRFVIGR